MITRLSIDDAITALQHKLSVGKQHLHGLFEITKAINQNESSEMLLDLYRSILVEQLQVERIAFFQYNEVWKGTLWSKASDEFLAENDYLMQFNEATILDATQQQYLYQLKYIIPVYHKETPLAFVLLDDFRLASYFEVDELFEFAQIITHIVVVAIENKRLFKKENQKKELEKELDLASKIQAMLVPNKLPKNNLYEFSGLYIPYKGIGGDYYDVISINNDELVFCIADISGKGISAALVMANIQAYINAFLDIDNSLESLVQKLNNKIYSLTDGDKYVTLFIARYNILNRKLQYINCGHVPPILFSNGSYHLLDKGTTMLGSFQQLPKLHINSLTLDKDATIVCYTDGLTELENERGSVLSQEAIYEFLYNNYQYNPYLLNKLLHEYIAKFKRNMLFTDDISLLTAKFY